MRQGYTGSMAVLERHQDLVAELIAEVEAYKPDVDRELLTRAFEYAADAHAGQVRQSGQEFIYHPWGAAKILAGPAARRGDARRRRCCTTSSRTPTTDIDEIRAEFGDEIATARRGRDEADPRPVPEPRARRGRELPQADRRDGRGRARDPDQARRPPAQPAHDRVPRQAEAAAEGARDARGLRAARAPPRYPRAQVGARGPRVPDAAPAQVRGDQADGRRAAHRSRGARARSGDGACRRSSTRSTSPPRSRAARSTSIRSTTRWRRRAASSTRSTT